MSSLASVETPDWIWFEEGLAYDNARLPQALMLTGMATQTPDYVDAGLRSLRWLMTQQTTSTGHFRPVGTAGFGEQRQPPARLRSAAAGSHGDDRRLPDRVAGGRRCRMERDRNQRIRLVSRPQRFVDGPLSIPRPAVAAMDLHPDRANENRGGESVVSYLLGLADIRQLARVNVGVTPPWRFAPSAAHFQLPLQEPRASCRKPPSCTGRRSICVPTPRG